MLWRWDQVLKTHPNGMRFSSFGENGELLATNEYFRYVHTADSPERLLHLFVVSEVGYYLSLITIHILKFVLLQVASS